MNAVKHHISESEKAIKNAFKHIKSNIIAYLLTLILCAIGYNVKMSYDNGKDLALLREDSVTKLSFSANVSNLDKRLYILEENYKLLMQSHQLTSRGDLKKLNPFLPFMDVDKAMLN
jgi:hypothetical protein